MERENTEKEKNNSQPSKKPIIPEIAIVDANALTCIGLKGLMEQIIPMAVIRVFHNYAELMDDTPDMYMHYFVSPQIFMEHNAFFYQRKHKTILLGGNSPQFQLSDFAVLNIYDDEEKLAKSMLRLHQHAHRFGYPIKGMQVQQKKQSDLLSAREIEVLVLITKGFINKEIADKLNISITTVITHRKNITEKLGIKSVSGLTIYAVMNGYVDVDQI
ncbi:MAG: helix-turn-helix transcriptional regulator [Parabacteroides sp.]|nr:helix-turn-helix transcriptional regulator [Bacteroidaceae bacterium]